MNCPLLQRAPTALSGASPIFKFKNEAGRLCRLPQQPCRIPPYPELFLLLFLRNNSSHNPNIFLVFSFMSACPRIMGVVVKVFRIRFSFRSSGTNSLPARGYRLPVVVPPSFRGTTPPVVSIVWVSPAPEKNGRRPPLRFSFVFLRVTCPSSIGVRGESLPTSSSSDCFHCLGQPRTEEKGRMPSAPANSCSFVFLVEKAFIALRGILRLAKMA